MLTTCASYAPQYAQSNEQPPTFPVPGSVLAHRTYLVGDAGAYEGKDTTGVLHWLRQELALAGKNTTVLYLGNNVYPTGFPPKGLPGRARAEQQLERQLAPVVDYAGEVVWLPGNFDWKDHSIEGLKRARNYLRERMGRKHVWEPKVGCGGPEVINANANLVYIIIDTQWYLANWKKHPGVNEGCAAGNRTEFLRLIREAFRANREKQIIVAMHHPMETYGRYGGRFTWLDHVQPAPIVGSVKPFLRGNIGSRQDNVNSRFQELRQQLVRIAKINGNATFVSSHEQALQYIEKDRQRYVVSGAAGRARAVDTGEGSLFASGQPGYGVLDLYADGSLWLSFFHVNDKGTHKKLVYRKEISPPTAADRYEAPKNYPNYPIRQDTVIAPLVCDDYTRSGIGRSVLGDHYRDAYGLALKLPVLDLSTHKGGLRPIKVGGGSQTVTLRLEARDGRQYTLRSLDKNPKAALGARLSRSKIIQALIEDGFTAAHPLAALPVIGLARAAGVYHTNPAVYYVPEQPALGKYNPNYGGQVYLLEERPDNELWRDYEDFGNPSDIRSTDQVLKDLRKHPGHILDYSAIARARAFDILLGDWDRHDDQWRWKQEKRADGRTYYTPIPRDRDQVFSHYDGLFLGLARRIIPDIRPLEPFRLKPSRTAGATRGARFFDATFTAGIAWSQWEQEVELLQYRLSDSIIDAAFRDVWSTELISLNGEEIIETLKLRRDKLDVMIRKFYEMRARTVEVVGTDKGDVFTITVNDDRTVRVQVAAAQANGPLRKTAYFDRTFHPGVTKEIILFGLENDDRFVFVGKDKPRLRIRLVGGPDEDGVVYGSDTKRLSLRNVRYYDYRAQTEKSDLSSVRGIRDRRSQAAKYNIYSRLSEDKDINAFTLLPILGLNPDNGVLLGAVATKTTYGFKKEPFSTRQVLDGHLALGSGGGRMRYTGEFTDVIGDKELLLEGRLQSPFYAVNFYGFGNETLNPELEHPLGRDFVRVRQQVVEFSPKIMKRLNPAASYAFGPAYTITETERIEGRFLTVNTTDKANEGVFSNFHYLALEGRFEFDNRIPVHLPGRGTRFYLEGGYRWSVAGPGASFPYVKSDLTFNQKLDDYGDLTMANRVGYHQVFSDDLFYFQAATIGGAGRVENIRGFRRERFSGDRAFYFNNDIRYRLFSERKGGLPASIGILAGFDVGRVWLQGERSRLWHKSIGGGIFISPLDYRTITFSYFYGDGIGRFSFETGFFF